MLEDSIERLFLSLPVPEQAITPIQRSLAQYPQYIERPVKPANWHLTLLFLGAVKNPTQYYGRLKLPLPQQFVPTVRITHVGRGLHKHQLWAYAEPSAVLVNLRDELMARLKKMRFRFGADAAVEENDFVPHITIAKLFPVAGGVGLADFPVTVSWSAAEAQVVRSTPRPEGSQYDVQQTMSLAP